MKILGWVVRHYHLFVLLAVCVPALFLRIADGASLEREKVHPKENYLFDNYAENQDLDQQFLISIVSAS